MRIPENLHSRLVGWFKIIFPLGALALLSTLFLFSWDGNDQPAIPFSEIAEMAREQRISAPQFSGVANDGSIIAVSAKSARPDETRPDTIKVDQVSLSMDGVDGSHIDVTAPSGEIDGRARIAMLMGLARLETSTGYEMETNGLTANLETGVVTSTGLLEIHAPYGELTAGKVTIQLSDDDKGHQMLFTDGVHLIYTPQD